MSATVELDELSDRRVVVARVSGPVDMATAVDAVRQLAIRAEQRGWQGLLLDLWDMERPKTRLPLTEVYNAIRSMRKRTGMSAGQRLAVLMNPVSADPARLAFYRVVRGNWGAPRFEFFTDEPAALRWLAS